MSIQPRNGGRHIIDISMQCTREEKAQGTVKKQIKELSNLHGWLSNDFLGQNGSWPRFTAEKKKPENKKIQEIGQYRWNKTMCKDREISESMRM